MGYSTLSDLKKVLPERRLLELSDDDGVGTFENNETALAIVQGAIDEADAIIDTYLSDHYTVPLADPPKIITVTSAHLSVCALYERSHDLDAPKGLIEKRKRFMTMLDNIKTGKLKIGAETRRLDFAISKTEDDIEFTDDLLAGY